MEGMIAFAGGQIDTDTLYHENMHQWWGDNVTEDDYRMTFFKEGLATLAEFLYHARLAEDAAGGPSTPAGQAAFEASLVSQFNKIYHSGDSFWTTAPAAPTGPASPVPAWLARTSTALPECATRSVLKKVSSWGSAWPGFRFRRSPAAGPFALRSSPHSLPCRTRGQRRAGSAVRTTPGGPAAWSGGQHPGAVAAGQALPAPVSPGQRGGGALAAGVVPGRPG